MLTGALGAVRKWLRAQDLVWLFLFAALAIFSPDTNYNAVILLSLLAVFQICEGRIAALGHGVGAIAAVIVKLVVSYLLVGYTHALETNYYPILLLPIIDAATNFSFAGLLAVIAAGCASYASFLLFLDWNQEYLPPEQIRVLCLRLAFLPVVGFLVYQQARAKREEIRRSERTAEQLEATNRNLRRAEASLRRSERLAALGQLTAGLAHELRNPLGTIRGSAELLTQPATQGQPELLREVAGYIVSEADRTSHLVSRFLSFARPLAVRLADDELRPLLVELLAQAQDAAAARDVTLLLEPGPQRPTRLPYDRELLQVALQNLIQNAIEASPPGAVVTLRERLADKHVLVDVADCGPGIPPEHLESIFNPFFTTKPSGVGLGLAIVAKIADEHGGRVTVTNQPDGGALFTLALPRERSNA